MLKSLTNHRFVAQNEKLAQSFSKMQNLISELNGLEVPRETELMIQAKIDELNTDHHEPKAYRKTLRKAYNATINQVRKDMGLVPKNYYMILGMSLGMAVFGIPLGIIFGSMMGNLGLLSIGLPIGLAIGMAIGAGLDEKAAKEGKQLSISN